VLFEPKKRKISDAERARLNELNRRTKQNPVQRVRTVCPAGTDIRAGDDMAENGNRCPYPTDIRNESDCPYPTDISSSPSTNAAYTPPKLPWTTPQVSEITQDLTPEQLAAFERERLGGDGLMAMAA
jgi:hypothetical protein